MPNDQMPLGPLVMVLIVSGLILRYVFFSSPSTSSSANGTGRRARLQREGAEMLLQMFPQLDRRTILWQLQRNGGNVQAVTERILSGQVETPPRSFQPPPPPEAEVPAAPRPASAKPAQPSQPDLITRYNLQSRVGSGSRAEGSDDKAQAAEGWSSSRSERQALLKKRREQMILAARRKMEAKLAAEKEDAPATE